MLKYIKKAYIMSIASYAGGENPGQTTEVKKNPLKDKSRYDELTAKLLNTQKNLLEKPWNKKLTAKLSNILEKRTVELKKLEKLYNPELVKKFTTEQLQKYSTELNEFQNIRLASKEAQKNRNKRITSTNKAGKEGTKLTNWKDSLKSFLNEGTLAQENPKESTDKTKPIELKDIEFINWKDKTKYLPTSATKKGIWTPITKEQVQKILNDWKYTSVKDFQKKNNLDDDWKIWGKTFMVLHSKLEK